MLAVVLHPDDLMTFAVIVLIVYFLPTLFAKHDRSAIFVANLFLGWTLLGWIIILIWALTTPKTYVVVQKKGDDVWRIDALLGKKKR